MSTSKDANGFVDSRDHRRRELNWEACRLDPWVVAVLALASLAILAPSVAPLPRFSELVWWCIVLCAIQLFPVRSASGASLDVSFPVLLAAAFVFGPGVGTAVAAIAYLDPEEWSGQLTLGQAACNRSMRVLSVSSAGAVFQLLGGFSVGWPLALAVGLAAVLADMVVNYGLAALLLHRLAGLEVSAALHEMRMGPFRGFLAAYAAYGCLALPMAALYLRVGDWTLVTFLIPVLIARQAFSRAQQLEYAENALTRKDEAMRRVSAQIAQERSDERRRIASSLHDDVLQSLHFLTLHAQVIREDLRHGRLLQLEEDIPLLLKTSHELSDLTRSVISDLRSSPLGRRGVGPALADVAREMADEYEGSLALDIQTIRGDPVQHIVVYQIGREALANAVKHSRAANIWVSLREESGAVRLVVKDDGCGFDPAPGGRPNHFGLCLMEERATSAGGTVEVWSAPGRGTCVTAVFALPADDS